MRKGSALGDDGGLGRGYGLLTAIGADVIGGSAVAADISISDFRRSTEFNRHCDAYILADGECANPVLYSVANGDARRNGGVAAAFRERCARSGIGRYFDGYANGRHLVSNGRASLFSLIDHRNICS